MPYVRQASRVDIACCVVLSPTDQCEECDTCLSIIHWFTEQCKHYYAKFLLNKYVRPFVVSF